MADPIEKLIKKWKTPAVLELRDVGDNYDPSADYDPANSSYRGAYGFRGRPEAQGLEADFSSVFYLRSDDYLPADMPQITRIYVGAQLDEDGEPVLVDGKPVGGQAYTVEKIRQRLWKGVQNGWTLGLS